MDVAKMGKFTTLKVKNSIQRATKIDMRDEY